MKCSMVVALVLAACAGNEAGNLRATKNGDLSNPAVRGSPVDEVRGACGDGKASDGVTSLARHPYIQHVTSRSAVVGWSTTKPDGEHAIVTLPDGATVATVMAREERDAITEAGRYQMWASIDGLEPDTIYCYSVANGAPMTVRTGFRTAPAPDSTRTIGILAFGDSGSGSTDQASLFTRMFEFPYQLIIHTGDMAYDDGTIGQFEANVFGVYSELFRNVPVFPVPGNHEYNTQGGAPFRSVFALPGDSGERWYSYDWGRVHFAALDTQADIATQARWLDRDLAMAQQPWKIVYMHKPPYSSGSRGSDVDLRRALAPVLEKHRVQLVLAGHDHDYERTKPQNGVTYVVTGGGGKGTRDVGTSSFTAFSDEVIHFVYLEVGVDQLVLHAIDAMGTEFDSVVIAR